jgi:hypothetical protein
MMTGIAAVSVSAGYEILAEAFQYENKNEAPIVGSAVLGIVAIVGGISLVHEMRMDLAGPWKLRVIKYQINP